MRGSFEETPDLGCETLRIFDPRKAAVRSFYVFISDLRRTEVSWELAAGGSRVLPLVIARQSNLARAKPVPPLLPRTDSSHTGNCWAAGNRARSGTGRARQPVTRKQKEYPGSPACPVRSCTQRGLIAREQKPTFAHSAAIEQHPPLAELGEERGAQVPSRRWKPCSAAVELARAVGAVSGDGGEEA